MRGNILLPVLVFWPIAGALIGYGIGRKRKAARDYFAAFVGVTELLLAAFTLYQVAAGEEMSFFLPYFCDQGLYLKLDGFRALHGAVAALVWVTTTVFSREYLQNCRNRNRYYLFTLLTCGATMGVFLSVDLFTTFIFFEIMSFTSYVLVIHDETPEAMRAGETYVAVAVIGGMVMLMGLFLLRQMTGTLNMEELLSACEAVTDKGRLYLAGALILFGFGAKAGMYPLHVWLPRTYPAAPAPASAILSAILSKAGVFGVLVVSCDIFLHDSLWGSVMLAIGVITMFLGAVIAVFAMDLKRTLAGSSMSQIGFILVGVGMQGLLGHHNSLAVWGTLLHMVNHSLIKLVLFLAAGVVYMNLHRLDLNGIRGFGRNKPLLKVIFLTGYLGVIGMPLWNGYISKTLLHESIVEYIEILAEAGLSIGVFKAVEWIFLFSGGLTAAYMTKLFVAVFCEKNPCHAEETEASDKSYMNRSSALALGIPALLIPLIGVLPQVFMVGMAKLGQGFVHGEAPAHAIAFFSWTNLKGALISLAIGAAVYFGFIRTCLMKTDENGNRVYVDRWPGWLDLEYLVYRPLVQKALPALGGFLGVICDRIAEPVGAALLFLGAFASRLAGVLTDGLHAVLMGTLLRKRGIPETNPGDFEPGSMINRVRMSRTGQRITGSFSFGLLLFGVGFCIAMFYLIFVLLGR
ncbi:MAG: NADH dehydrogenase [Lachnospiraceae bacterium]|nr:NADH dehydrogenase [Lachnospiraceae bacterium]